MTGTRQSPLRIGSVRVQARRGGWWRGIGGLLGPAVALGLWVYLVLGVAAPLGGALARLKEAAPPSPPALAECGVPPGALASAESPRAACP